MENINVLINKARIEKRLDEMAREIEKDYKEKDIVFLVTLKGAVPFMWELAKRIKNNIIFEFIEVSSYKNNKDTGVLTLHKDIKDTVEGKDVIIIEDIVDTGKTIKFLLEHLKDKNPNSVKIATLLSKPSKMVTELNIDYTGFKIDDKFIVGFGLDDNQNLRNLPYIGYIE
ncbi:MAG: hypoxanthine phosphoribosyltransferase [Clostridia bacterium]|nr:hypoxanthine phosphoribosyltransferase [Clostridia bacterium]